MSGIDWKAYARVFDVFSSEGYTQAVHAFYVWIVEQLEARGCEPAGFLEVGAGTGVMAAKLVEWYPEARFTLVDSSPDMLESARERFADAPAVEIVQASGESYLEALAPGSVEVAVFCRSWFAMSEPPKTAAALVRALEPGGLAFVFHFARPIDIETLDADVGRAEPELWPIARPVYEDFNEGVASGRDRLYGEQEMRELWRRAGAEVVDYALDPQSRFHQFAIEKR